MEFYANLHLHSTHSDGRYTPTELAQYAAREGYKAAAVTDHDTATAYPEFKAECDRLGLECIFGVEFTAPSELLKTPSGKLGKFHLTAYHFDPEYPAMKEYLEGMGKRETDQTRILVERGFEIGYLKGFTWDEVLEYNKGIKWLCNEHVFRLMKSKGLISDRRYREFFDTVFGDYRRQVPPSYDFLSDDELIKLVHDAGGVIFVAHPAKKLHLIDALVKKGIDGMEVWHPDLSEEEKVEAYRIALDKGLYVSGGSDHSGYCGGTFMEVDDPKDSPYYIDMLSVGTTKQHFDEIKNRKISR